MEDERLARLAGRGRPASIGLKETNLTAFARIVGW
jgi:hypothetical protein